MVPAPFCTVSCLICVLRKSFANPNFKTLSPFEQWLAFYLDHKNPWNFTFFRKYGAPHAKFVPSLQELALLQIFDQICLVHHLERPLCSHSFRTSGYYSIFSRINGRVQFSIWVRTFRPSGFGLLMRTIKNLRLPEMLKRRAMLYLEKLPLAVTKYAIFREISQLCERTLFTMSLDFPLSTDDRVNIPLALTDATFCHLFVWDLVFFDIVYKQQQQPQHSLEYSGEHFGKHNSCPYGCCLAQLAGETILNDVHIRQTFFWHWRWWLRFRHRLYSTCCFVRVCVVYDFNSFIYRPTAAANDSSSSKYLLPVKRRVKPKRVLVPIVSDGCDFNLKSL